LIDSTQSAERLEWAAKVIGVSGFRDDARTISVLGDDGRIRAVVVYDTWSECDVNMHVASDGSARWMTRDALVLFFAYPFIQCGMRRVTALVPAKNAHALRFDRKLGFEDEGYFKHALPGGDLVALGMLRESCRFISQGNRNA
jgi:RimJ/RimL family protein N-acetyltransferase